MKPYRGYEGIPLPDIDVKPDLRILAPRVKINQVTEDRRDVSESLPVVITNAATCRGDADFPPDVAVGAMYRMGRKPPHPKCSINGLRAFTEKFVKRTFTPIPVEADIDVLSWIESTEYSRQRKDQLIQVWERLNVGDDINLLRTRVKSFLKDEGYEVPWKALRLINSREDYFKCFSGPLFKIISDEVFSHSWFIKTEPVELRPSILEEELYATGATYFCTDYKSMEAHFTRQVYINLEFVLYNYMCSLNPRAMFIMGLIRKTLGGVQNIVMKLMNISINATRMSGEMNTSLGNGFSNLMLFLYACSVTGAGDYEKGGVRGFVEGDDGIFRVQNPHLAPDEKWFENLGWLIKIIKTCDLNTASFCGNVFDVVDKVVVASPAKHLMNVGWCPRRYVGSRRAVKLQLLRAKGFSLAHQYNGCPILGDLGRHLVELTEGISIRSSIIDSTEAYKREHLRRYVNTGLPERREPTPRTRQLVYDLYGILPSTQIQCEQQLELIRCDDLWKETIYVDFPIPFDESLTANFETYTYTSGTQWVAPVSVNAQHRTLDYLRRHGKCATKFLEGYGV